MFGHYEPFEWEGREAYAWLPALLVVRDLALDSRTLDAVHAAADALVEADSSFPQGWEPLTDMLMRAESTASVRLGGATPPVSVSGYMNALDSARQPGALSIERLHRWHGLLCLPDDAFRTTQSWVGGSSPFDARYVPPPAENIERLMGDLVRFANGDSINPLLQAAVLHAQVEAIQPFAAGNRELGRLLVAWVLRRRGVLDRLPLPISVALGRDLGGYLSGLHLFREGIHLPIVNTLARACRAAATHADAMTVDALQLVDRWALRAGDLRRDSAARRLIPLLASNPQLDSVSAAAMINVSERAARTALHSLAERSILRPVADDEEGRVRGRPRHRFVAGELVDLAAGWAV
jgi:hypothetical protein